MDVAKVRNIRILCNPIAGCGDYFCASKYIHYLCIGNYLLYKYVRVLIKCLSAIVQMHCIGTGKDPAGFILKLNHKRHLLNKGMNEMFNKLNKNATIFKELSKTPSWWQTFKSNPDLYIEVRKDNQVNVYFEGGSVAKIHYCSRHKKLQVFTHHKYLGNLKAKTMYVDCSEKTGCTD